MVNLLVIVVLSDLCNIGQLSLCIIGFWRYFESFYIRGGEKLYVCWSLGISGEGMNSISSSSTLSAICWCQKGNVVVQLVSLLYLVCFIWYLQCYASCWSYMLYLVSLCKCAFVKYRGSVDPSSVCICIQMQVLMHSKICTHLGGARIYFAVCMAVLVLVYHNTMLENCKFLECHQTPKRGRLKAHSYVSECFASILEWILPCV